MTTSRAQISKAVIPAAGLGTRFLPATKATPKEMLPVVDKPAIQYVVEEAVAAGLSDVLMVTGRNKRPLEDHFDRNYELEQVLRDKGDDTKLSRVEESSDLATMHYVRQGDPRGLGHAILCAAPHVGDQPFAVLLGDDLMDPRDPLLTHMIQVREEHGGSVIALMEVPPESIHPYGCAAAAPTGEQDVVQVSDLVEKPRAEEAPSNLAIIGRYVLTPDIFPALAAIQSDRTGEIQLTNGLRELLKSRPIYACEVKGVRHDTGNKLGFLKAVVYFALRRSDLAGKFTEYLASLDLGAFAGKRCLVDVQLPRQRRLQPTHDTLPVRIERAARSAARWQAT